MESPLIVIVDDIPKNIQLLGQVLKQNGYRILALTDSKKAVHAIEKNQPALVLLDIMMPDIDGFEICSILKSKAETADIPVIFLTAKTQIDDIVKGFEIGAVDYVTKPFNNQELLMRVKTQVALQDAIKRVAKANAAKSDFLANISHDIRSPMNGIQNILQILLKTELTNTQKDYIITAQQAGTSLLCLINDLLDLSKIEANQLELEQIQFDLRELLENISDIYSIEAYKKGLEYACIIQDDLHTTVIGDPNRLRQIIINLINNAIKFTDDGEVSISVSRQSEDTLLFAVQDTGKGIAAHRLNQLFKPYSQLDSSTTRKYGGTGLGLSISKQLVALMNGNILVKSDEGMGSTFEFTALIPDHKIVSDNQASGESSEQIDVLIIHPHDKSRQAFVQILKKFHCQCHEAKDSIDTFSVLRDLNINQTECKLMFVDQLTYDEDISCIKDRFEENPAVMNARWVLLKKIGTDRPVALHDVLIQPVHYGALLNLLEQTTSYKRVKEKPSENKYRTNEILIVDDEVINRLIAENNVKELGFIPDLAGNCDEALAKLARKDYLFVLADLFMPDMSAIELTKIIRNPESNVLNHDVIIIVISASDLKSDKQACKDVGVNGYLTKPYAIEHLKNLIDPYLDQMA
jgi:signal transduction histidine kinase